jgi:ribosome recycling factor
MTEELELIYDELKSSNAKSVDHLENELMKVRAGKATPSMLSGVLVDYYGSPTPIHQVGNVNSMDARTLTVQAFEKNMLNEIAKGIMNANLGLNPQNNGEQLIIQIPLLTEERRRDLVKKARAEAEHAKVGIRNNRKDAIDMVKSLKTDGLSEDMTKDAENEIQNLTNGFIKKIDDLVDLKEKDIMTI